MVYVFEIAFARPKLIFFFFELTLLVVLVLIISWLRRGSFHSLFCLINSHYLATKKKTYSLLVKAVPIDFPPK